MKLLNISLRSMLLIVATVYTIGCDCRCVASEANRIPILRLHEVENGKSVEWIWYAERTALKKQPEWDGYSSSSPFPIDKAVANAMGEIRKSHPNITKWKVDSIRVRPLDAKASQNSGTKIGLIWYYHIQVIPSDDSEFERFENRGKMAMLSRVVLMDGTILSPVSKKEKEPKDSAVGP